MEVNSIQPYLTHEDAVKAYKLDRHCNAVGWPKNYVVYDEQVVDFIEKDIPNGSTCRRPMEEAPFTYFYNGEWVKTSEQK